jgi:ABC-type spermidine/putrescine transport system permease subunit II
VDWLAAAREASAGAPLASLLGSDTLACLGVSVALLVAVAGVLVHRRREALRSVLRLVSPLALIFPALLLGHEQAPTI